VELAVRTGLTQLGGRLLEGLLAADAGHRGAAVDCGAGHQARLVSYRGKAVDTVLGPVTVRRAWYHCAECGHGLAPRDAELGVAGQAMSPGLRKMAARAAAAVPFAKAAALVGELAGITLTGKRAGRSAEAGGAAAARVIEAQAGAIAARALVPLPPPSPAPGKLYIAIDGTGVPVVAAETEGRDGKGDDGKARTREVKLCAVFTQTTADEDGYPVRDPGSSSYLATFAPAADFGMLMAAEARRRGAEHVRQLTILGDGAVWIWNLAGQHFPAATQIAGLYHAREHAHDLAALATRLLRDSQPDWLTQRLEELDAGNIPALLAAGRGLKFAGSWPVNATSNSVTSRSTPTGCATPTSGPWACSPAPGWSRPAARPSSGSGSNCRACAGPSPAPPASPPCAARKPATGGKRSGSARTTRHRALTSPDKQADLATYKFVPHPQWSPARGCRQLPLGCCD